MASPVRVVVVIPLVSFDVLPSLKMSSVSMSCGISEGGERFVPGVLSSVGNVRGAART